jgi:hypothetical protein
MPVFEVLIEIVSAFVKALLPGSLLFLLVGLTIGVAFLLLGKGRRPAAVVWLAALAVFYWIISLPVVPSTLERWLGAGYAPLASATEAEGAAYRRPHAARSPCAGWRTLDLPAASGYRLLEAERPHRLLGEPILLLSGGRAEGGEGKAESEAMKATWWRGIRRTRSG